MLDSIPLDAALFVLPAGITALGLWGHAWSAYPTCRHGLRALRSYPVYAVAGACGMLYLASLLLTVAVAALLFHA